MTELKISKIYEPLSSISPEDSVARLVLHRGNMVLRDLDEYVPVRKLRLSDLERRFGPLVNADPKSRAEFEERLTRSYAAAANNPAQHGYLLNRQGAFTLPSGELGFVRGNQVLCRSRIPYYLLKEIQHIRLAGDGNSPAPLLDILPDIQFPGIMAFAYTVMASVRSLILDSGIELQAVMSLVGPPGKGKSVTTERICLPYRNENGKHHALLQASSTQAAVERAAVACYDMAMVLDDMAKSGSPAVERERKKLCAAAVRIGAGIVPTTKCGKDNLDTRYCNAGLVMTAEFTLENTSDLERLIIVPVTEQMALPHSLTPELIGDAIRHFSFWMLEHHEEFVTRLRREVSSARFGSHSVRVETNYACLRESTREFLRSMEPLGCTSSVSERIMSRLEEAITESLAAQDAEMSKISENKAIGNLAYIILGGIKSGAFRTTKKIEKFTDSGSKKDAVFVKREFCVLPESLVYFVRAQPGYHDWTRQRITQQLKDYGALRTQRNGDSTSNTVKVASDAPRTFRIVLKALEEAKEKY